MIAAPKSILARIFGELVIKSRQTGQLCRKDLAGGAQLVILVVGDTITVTIKRKDVQVGANELATFRRHFGVPADAEILTPPEQGTREVEGETWYYVTLRWAESAVPA